MDHLDTVELNDHAQTYGRGNRKEHISVIAFLGSVCGDVRIVIIQNKLAAGIKQKNHATIIVEKERSRLE